LVLVPAGYLVLQEEQDTQTTASGTWRSRPRLLLGSIVFVSSAR
jgi:hypothetical protein